MSWTLWTLVWHGHVKRAGGTEANRTRTRISGTEIDNPRDPYTSNAILTNPHTKSLSSFLYEE